MRKNMNTIRRILNRFLNWSCFMAGKPATFILAITLLFLWILGGIVWGFTTNWLLIIDTIATINASMMVFIILHTQNRESRALHLKIDELIRVTENAEFKMIAIEEKEEEELEEIRKELTRRRNKNDRKST